MGKINFSHHYKRRGQGEVVILLHGALADKRMWEKHIAFLEHNYDVISITQRHFGRDGATDEGDFGIDTHAQDLADFIGNLHGNKPIHLIAWSYGADVALNVLVNRPDLVSSVFLYEPGYPGYLSETEMAIFKEDAATMFEPIFRLVEEEKLEDAVQTLIDASGNRVGYFMSQAAESQYQQLENAHTLPKQLCQREVLKLMAEFLLRIKSPVTIAWGSNTRPLFSVVAQAASSLIPGAREVCVENANHMLPIEYPDVFSNLVHEHIESIKG